MPDNMETRWDLEATAPCWAKRLFEDMKQKMDEVLLIAVEEAYKYQGGNMQLGESIVKANITASHESRTTTSKAQPQLYRIHMGYKG